MVAQMRNTCHNILQKEYQNLLAHPIANCLAAPSRDNIQNWNVLIMSLQSGFRGIPFEFNVEFPDTYPEQAPKVRWCCTQQLTMDLKLDVLDAWSKDDTISTLLVRIQSFLFESSHENNAKALLKMREQAQRFSKPTFAEPTLVPSPMPEPTPEPIEMISEPVSVAPEQEPEPITIVAEPVSVTPEPEPTVAESETLFAEPKSMVLEQVSVTSEPETLHAEPEPVVEVSECYMEDYPELSKYQPKRQPKCQLKRQPRRKPVKKPEQETIKLSDLPDLDLMTNKELRNVLRSLKLRTYGNNNALKKRLRKHFKKSSPSKKRRSRSRSVEPTSASQPNAKAGRATVVSEASETMPGYEVAIEETVPYGTSTAARVLDGKTWTAAFVADIAAGQSSPSKKRRSRSRSVEPTSQESQSSLSTGRSVSSSWSSDVVDDRSESVASYSGSTVSRSSSQSRNGRVVPKVIVRNVALTLSEDQLRQRLVLRGIRPQEIRILETTRTNYSVELTFKSRFAAKQAVLTKSLKVEGRTLKFSWEEGYATAKTLRGTGKKWQGFSNLTSQWEGTLV